jgi:hypothetical protein
MHRLRQVSLAALALIYDIFTNRHSLQPASPAHPRWPAFVTRVFSPSVLNVLHFPTVRLYVTSSVKLPAEPWK